MCGNGSLRITDFGSSELDGFCYDTISFTPEYCSSEVLYSATPASDIYSLGLTFFYLLTGRHAYERPRESSGAVRIHTDDMNDGDVRSISFIRCRFEKLLSFTEAGSPAQFFEHPPLPISALHEMRVPPAIIQILEEMCSRNPRARPTALQVEQRLRAFLADRRRKK